jgi:hypothetical protein
VFSAVHVEACASESAGANYRRWRGSYAVAYTTISRRCRACRGSKCRLRLAWFEYSPMAGYGLSSPLMAAFLFQY